MKRIVLKLTLYAALFLVVIARGAELKSSSTTSEDILNDYLALPGSELRDQSWLSDKSWVSDQWRGSNRKARLEVLRALSETPDALAAVKTTLPLITNGWQRAELAEMLGRSLQTKESASVLIHLLGDSDEGVRGQALHGLRLMAARIDRSGRRGIQAEPAHFPKVDGLVPTIISVAKDPSPKMRGAALYALADTREPQAIAEIKAHLRDQDQGVRFQAACLLSEVNDGSGLSELKAALEQIRHLSAANDFRFYSQAESVMLALERITGKSLGEIPLQPSLHSSGDKAREAAERYHTLVESWSVWLNHQPSPDMPAEH